MLSIKENSKNVTALPVSLSEADKNKLEKMLIKSTTLLGLWDENSLGILIEIGEGSLIALIGDLKNYDINLELIRSTYCITEHQAKRLLDDFHNPMPIMGDVLKGTYDNITCFTNGVFAAIFMNRLNTNAVNYYPDTSRSEDVNRNPDIDMCQFCST